MAKAKAEKISYKALCELVADELDGDLTKKDVKKVLDTMQEAILRNLKKGKNVAIDIGLFKRKDKEAKPKRKGVDPFTGKEREFEAKPASKGVKFTPNKKLKEAVNTK